MAEEFKVELFPKNSDEALALLYVQRQDLSGMTPTQIHDMYQNAYFEIRKDRIGKKNAGWFNEKTAEARRG